MLIFLLNSSVNNDEESIECYNGNNQLPVFTKDPIVLRPHEVMELLVEKKGFPACKVCTSQPLHVEHHRTFIVDLDSLKNTDDVKCDDMGGWKNNSSHKFPFKVRKSENDERLLVSPTNDKSDQNNVILKREYFSLRHDTFDDVMKRIDTILRKSRYNCVFSQYYM